MPTSPSIEANGRESNMSNAVDRVVIGVDPHKLSATIEDLDQHEKKLGTGRFLTDQAGYKAMRAYANQWQSPPV